MATQYEEEERQRRLNQATSIPGITPPPEPAGPSNTLLSGDKVYDSGTVQGRGNVMAGRDALVGPEPGLYTPTATGFTPERNVMGGGPASATGDSPFWRELRNTVNNITGVSPGVSPVGSAYSGLSSEQSVNRGLDRAYERQRERQDAYTGGTVGGANTIPTDLGDRNKTYEVSPGNRNITPGYVPERTRDLNAMMGMPLDELEKLRESLPAGKAPIHEIRGTQQSWWNPQTGDSYGTLEEALAGKSKTLGEREKVDIAARQATTLKALEQAGLLDKATIDAIRDIQKAKIEANKLKPFEQAEPPLSKNMKKGVFDPNTGRYDWGEKGQAGSQGQNQSDVAMARMYESMTEAQQDAFEKKASPAVMSKIRAILQMFSEEKK